MPNAPVPTAGQQSPRAPRGLALAALIVGIVALLIAAVPVLGAVLGVVAIILGAVALRKKQSRGLSLTGLILGCIATIASIIMSVTIAMLAGSFFAALEKSTVDVVVSDEDGTVELRTESDARTKDDVESSDAPVRWDAFDTADAPASSRAGTSDDPHAIGSRFTIDGWDIVVNLVDTDAADRVLAFAPENDAPGDGERYVLLNVTVNNPKVEARSLASLRLHYDTPSQMYSANRPRLEVPEPALFDGDRNISGNFTGYVALRTKDVDGELIRFTGGDRTEVYVAVG